MEEGHIQLTSTDITKAPSEGYSGMWDVRQKTINIKKQKNNISINSDDIWFTA